MTTPWYELQLRFVFENNRKYVWLLPETHFKMLNYAEESCAHKFSFQLQIVFLNDMCTSKGHQNQTIFYFVVDNF